MMSSHNGASMQIRNPGKFVAPAGLKQWLGALVVVGVASFLYLLMTDSKRAWSVFVLNHFYFMSLAVGGIVFAAIQWITGAMWSAPVRRLAESFTAYIPAALVTFLLLIPGFHTLYHWTHLEAVQGDEILLGKSGYLNTAFFVLRNLLALGIWIFFSKKMIGNSLAQDQTKSMALTLENRKWSAVFLILFALTFTMSSFDQIMSLDPHWFSTMFGVYCFAGMLYMTFAMLCVFTLYFKKKGYLEGIVNEHHLHDIGKFMFAFTVFWAYIGFSQFMLIWYANMPEETGYYIKRFAGGWFAISVFLLIGKFITPFLLLMPRPAKRKEGFLLKISIFMLIAQWIDVLWMVQPEFFPEGPRVGIFEVGTSVGFLGLFALFAIRFLSRNNVLAVGDPRLSESVEHHHQ